jgi:hypothetical protein
MLNESSLGQQPQQRSGTNAVIWMTTRDDIRTTKEILPMHRNMTVMKGDGTINQYRSYDKKRAQNVELSFMPRLPACSP